MKSLALLFMVAIGLASVARAGSNEGAARVLGEDIQPGELASATAVPDETMRLVERVQARIARHYVESNGLRATASDLAEVSAYEADFELRDRAQRARKLAELGQRLAAGIASADARAQTEEFRRVLLRLARRDAESDLQSTHGPGDRAAVRSPLIEMWKMNRDLYERYGGRVVLTELGPYPHGAWEALIAEYERAGWLEFRQAEVRQRFFRFLAVPPGPAVSPSEVDFTPFWKKPIPPSYFPD